MKNLAGYSYDKARKTGAEFVNFCENLSCFLHSLKPTTRYLPLPKARRGRSHILSLYGSPEPWSRKRTAMTQDYYRFEPDRTLGIICSAVCNTAAVAKGKYAASGALESVYLWNVRTGELVSRAVVLSGRDFVGAKADRWTKHSRGCFYCRVADRL